MRPAARLSGIIFGLALLAGCAQPTPATTSPATTDHTKGPATAKIQILEFGDYQCPACSIQHEMIQQVLAKYGSDVYFAYRHFPLESIHKHAVLAGEASEAANAQGKFWEMHDLLFSRQDAWAALPDPTETFVGYATELGLDAEKFRTALTKHTYRTMVRASGQRAMALGINSTPTFFLNGEKIGSPSFAQFDALISAALSGGASSTPGFLQPSVSSAPLVPVNEPVSSAPVSEPSSAS